MFPKTKIYITVPGKDKSERYFSFKLKQGVENEPAKYAKPKRIFVLSGAEGDFRAFCKLLIRHHIVDKYLNWSFDTGHLVILGNCFDRIGQFTECLWFVYSLEDQAKRQGGYVHFILGKNELMHLNGDWRFLHPHYADIKPGSKNSNTALYNGNSELWLWLCTKNIIEKVGDRLFIYEGLLGTLNEKLYKSVTKINRLAREHYNQPYLSWHQEYKIDMVREEQVDAILNKFEVSSIIAAHNSDEQTDSSFNGKLIKVSKCYNNENSQGLLISTKTFILFRER